MKCPHCLSEISPDAGRCPACRREVESAPGSAAGAAEVSGLAAAAISGEVSGGETGVAVGAAKATAPPVTNINDTQSRRLGWSPRKERVEAWAVSRELNHYEVLEVNSDAPVELVAERVRALEGRLQRWAADPMNAVLQKLGSAGMNRLFELQQDVCDAEARAGYDRRLDEERRAAALRRVREVVRRCIQKDMALQWNEWKFTVLPAAEDEGISREELEAILAELRGGGVLTGLPLDGREVRTILELKDACDGRGDLLVEPLRDGRLTRWLDLCAVRKDLAEEARLVREQYAGWELCGAHRILLKMGEQRLVVAAGADRQEVFASLKEWVEGVYCRDIEGPSLRALEDGRLENWLGVALNQERLARVAAAERGGGRIGLWRLVWETGERAEAAERGYEKTKLLVRDFPKSWEAHYQHGVYCALTKRTKEMLSHLRQAVKGDNGYATRAVNDPALQAVRKEVLPLVKDTVPITSFKFKQGEAFSVADLIMMCDRSPDEAQEYLYNGYLERWLAEKQGEGALASQARTITSKTQPKDRRKGVEFFVREMCQAIGVEALPVLSAEPARIDFGKIPVGGGASACVHLENHGRGQAWGKITVEPELPGVSLSASSFSQHGEPFAVRLDTLRVTPGRYDGVIVAAAEGLPTAVEVPLRFEVLPLDVKIEPPQVKLGKVMHGTRRTATVMVGCAPEGGRLFGKRKKLQPPLAGVRVKGELDGASNRFEVAVDTAKLETGKKYKTALVVESNVGPVQVPIEFKTSLHWKWILFWRTSAFSVGGGAVLFAARYLMGSVGGIDDWFLDYATDAGTVITTGAFGAVTTAALILAFRESRPVRMVLGNRYVRQLTARKFLGLFKAEERVISIGVEEFDESRRRPAPERLE